MATLAIDGATLNESGENLSPWPGVTVLAVAGELVDVSAFHVLPGLVNAHDHLHLNSFPSSPCRAPYAHADDWVRDMATQIEGEAFRALRAISAERRAWHGALKNVLAGTTTVVHHDPWLPVFDHSDFPVAVVPATGWAHSLRLAGQYGPLVAASFAATPADRPWFIHLAEGTDLRAASELASLAQQGCLEARTRLVHGVGLGPGDLRTIREAGAALILCPSANALLLGEATRAVFARRMTDRLEADGEDAPIRLGIGTDSRLTGARDLLDELRFASSAMRLAGPDTSAPAVPEVEGAGAASRRRRPWREGLLGLATSDGAEVAGRPKAGRLASGAPADLAVLPRIGTAAQSLLGARRADMAMVWSRGRLVLACPAFAWLFDALEEPAVKACLDGRPVVLARRVVEPALGDGLGEPGLEIVSR